VRTRDNNPPSRERILQWQARQDFRIGTDADDPHACNVYRGLRFPDDIYDNFQEFWEERSETQAGAASEVDSTTRA
jgi:hypothetical protein